MTASVLYDAPGPRARLRYRVYSVITILVLAGAAWFVYHGLADKGQFTAEKWKPFTDAGVWKTYLLPGLRGTLVAAALSIVLALVLGMVFGILRLSDHRLVRWVAGFVVEVSRAIPVLILMIFLFNLFAKNNVFPSDQLALSAVVLALTVYNGSVIAEIVRSGIKSLPRGQSEAAVALGMRKTQVMLSILLPQAITAMLPALISQMVVALKDSALGYQITYLEIVRKGTQLGAAEQNPIPSLIVVAIIMITINYLLTVVATRVEKWLRTRKRGTGTALRAGAIAPPPGMNAIMTDQTVPGVIGNARPGN
ncbi:amino acid ABC transporter permease [Nocardia yunnanensis]|uniref:Amino acid ABC transporter permease n=1 Tax=Nocardia yunnanensis TaxID=2382165 RepID=A0A386ZCM4_9NOCA|nr:amino acid ABC transporter permease [Nocardia yunnanensis]AYF74864.1 amino acid ABC transporter permease [Nocardia yunnanensis]